MSDDERCPHCDVDLKGEPIPENVQHYYGGKMFFSRAIGVYSRERDRTVEWACPICDGRWPR